MKYLSKTVTVCATAVLSVGAVYGQSVISAKSGLVHYVEGSVSVDGKPVSGKAGVFSQINKDGVMTTTEGRAEVLMTPGVFLRVGEQSGIRMVSTSLSDTRVAIESGRVLLESDTPMKGNIVTVLYKDVSVMPTKPGLYEITANPPQLKVYSGEADVTSNGSTTIAKEGKSVTLAGALAQDRFANKDGDDLYRWSKLRSGYLSEANASAASSQSMGMGGYSNFNGVGGYAGSWFYNSAFGMYTYMPFAGTMFSPFGYGLWSPYTVNQAYPYGYGYGSAYAPTGSTGPTSASGSLLGSLVHPVHLPAPPSRSIETAEAAASSGGYRGLTPSSLQVQPQERPTSATGATGAAGRGGSGGSRGH